jgi:hypothetical protein
MRPEPSDTPTTDEETGDAPGAVEPTRPEDEDASPLNTDGPSGQTRPTGIWEVQDGGSSAESAFWASSAHQPLGATEIPEQWNACIAELREALAVEGIADADVRLKGSAARFCSENPKKWFRRPRTICEPGSPTTTGTPPGERAQRADSAASTYRAAGFSERRPLQAPSSGTGRSGAARLGWTLGGRPEARRHDRHVEAVTACHQRLLQVLPQIAQHWEEKNPAE